MRETERDSEKQWKKQMARTIGETEPEDQREATEHASWRKQKGKEGEEGIGLVMFLALQLSYTSCYILEILPAILGCSPEWMDYNVTTSGRYSLTSKSKMAPFYPILN